MTVNWPWFAAGVATAAFAAWNVWWIAEWRREAEEHRQRMSKLYGRKGGA